MIDLRYIEREHFEWDYRLRGEVNVTIKTLQIHTLTGWEDIPTVDEDGNPVGTVYE